MSKGKHKDYSKAHRVEYKKRFKERYGMTHEEWAKFKKNTPKEVVAEVRRRATINQ